MSDAKDVTFTLKVIINKEKTKVFLAEADSDFADVLLSFLTLPLGKIVKVLEQHYGNEAPVIGSLSTLYNGVANLDGDHFWTEGGKQMLLNPRSVFGAECRKLKLDINDNQPTKYYCCESSNNDCGEPRDSNISMYYDSLRCRCGKIMKKELGIKESSKAADADADAGGGVFTVDTASFIISDDLRILPNVIGFYETVQVFGITDIDEVEPRNVTFGFSEIMDLLKASLLSSTPMSDVILNKRQMVSATARTEPLVSLHQIEIEAATYSTRMIMKIMVQKSTNKLLFAQAREDFIDVLFSILTVPLAGVECLLEKNSSLKNIDNLYRSIADVIDCNYLKTPDTKTRLIKPKLPYGYISKNRILPLFEQSAPDLYLSYDECLHPNQSDSFCKSASHFRSPKGLEENYVKRPRMYIVTDNLIVTPFGMGTSVSILNGLKVAISDVKEVELRIGLEEVLSILKASLTSTCALTNGLNNIILRKKPKQER